LTLRGNIFKGNSAGSTGMVSGGSSGGYNVSDLPDGTGSANSGWTFTGDDVQRTDVQFDLVFRPSSATGLPAVPSSTAGFPGFYFDGSDRGLSSVPGAMPVQP
jgi:hypothetical protein